MASAACAATACSPSLPQSRSAWGSARRHDGRCRRARAASAAAREGAGSSRGVVGRLPVLGIRPRADDARHDARARRAHPGVRAARGVDYNGVWADVGRAGDRPCPTGSGSSPESCSPLLASPRYSAGRSRGGRPNRRRAGAVISEGLWQRQFGRDSTVLGKALRGHQRHLHDRRRRAGRFRSAPKGSVAWVTFAGDQSDLLKEGAYGTLDLVGRLRPGRTIEEARRELDRMVTEVDGSQWSTDSRLLMTVRPLEEVVVGQVRPAIQMLGAAALLVFLVAVLNLGKSAGRPRRGAAAGVRHPPRHRGDPGGAGEAARDRDRAAGRAGWRPRLGVGIGGLAGAAGGRAGGPASHRGHVRQRLGPPGWRWGSGSSRSPSRARCPRSPSARPTCALPRGGRCRLSGTRPRAFTWTGALAAQVALAVVTLIGALLLVRTLHRHLQQLEAGFAPEDLGVAQIVLLAAKRTTAPRWCGA